MDMNDMARSRTKSKFLSAGSAVALAVIGLGTASCGPVPEETDLDQTDPGEAELIESAAVTPGDVFSVLQGITEALQKHTDLLGEMEPSLVDLNHKLDAIEEEVIKVSALVKAVEMRQKKAEIDGDRQKTIIAGLFDMREHPDHANTREFDFEGIAEKYIPEAPTLDVRYFFTGLTHDEATRFDHRLAEPLFILAVDAWVQARLVAGEGMSVGARAKLRQFATDLEANIARIRSRVSCSRVKIPSRSKGKYHTPCHYVYTYRDAIQEDTSSILPNVVGCGEKKIETEAQCTGAFLGRRYNTSAMAVIARAWRAIADAPDAPIAKNVFVTSALYTGNLGGLAGADSKCQDRARLAGLPGTYKAWLSDSTGSPATRFSKAGGAFVLAKRNVVVANSWAEFASPTHRHALDSDENGAPVPLGIGPCSLSTGGHVFWSDTSPSGSVNFALSCNNWTSTVGDPFDGPVVGRTDTPSTGWSSWCHGGGMCQGMNPLVCVQQ
jgi:hypothetical protein